MVLLAALAGLKHSIPWWWTDCLAKAPYGAVLAQDLYAALDPDSKAAKKVVEAMAIATLVAFRPASGGHQFGDMLLGHAACCMLRVAPGNRCCDCMQLSATHLYGIHILLIDGRQPRCLASDSNM